MSRFAGSLALVLIALLAGCSRQEPAAPQYLAKVGSRLITAQDLIQEVERRRAAKRPVPNKEELLREMITSEALLQRATKAGLQNEPQLQREIANLIIGRLRERELTPQVEKVSVTAEELQTAYQENIARYTQPAKARLAILFLEASSNTSAAKRGELRDRLLEARRRLDNEKASGGRGPAAGGFGSLAVEYSDETTSRYRGGDIGWLDMGRFSYRWPRQVLEAGYALEKGAVSDVMDAQNGLYLIMKTDSRDGVVTPFDQVEPSLRQNLILQKRRALEDAFRQETVQSANADINSAALNALHLLPVTPPDQSEPPPPALPLAGY
jgi:peptidyl-prolyl cis-trans isomerase C